MKKILLLGGSYQQIAAIKAAKRLGFYTILCDYLLDNPGQFVADKYYPISTTDKEQILGIAKRERVDGILAYASDPAAPTAAYVAEKLGLTTNPYHSVEILCNKDLFREFLRKNGFAAPKSDSYKTVKAALEDVAKFSFPIIVKPVDSSGSKGVTVLYDVEKMEDAVKFSLSFSRSHRVIVEEFIEKAHPYLIGGDIFVSDGVIVQWGIMNCHRDSNVNNLVPIGKSYPALIDEDDFLLIKDTLQRLVTLLDIHAGAMNVELILDKNKRVWLLDVGPRNGGNMIPELLGMIFGVDVVEMSIRAAMGEKFGEKMQDVIPFYATYNIHTASNGVYDGIEVSDAVKPYVVRICVYKKIGDIVEYFDNASKAIGIVFLKFSNQKVMIEMMERMSEMIKVKVK